MLAPVLSSLFLALQAVQVQARACGAEVVNGKAVYILTNEQTNRVVSLRIAADGLLADPSSGKATETGGSGANGVTAMGAAGPDALFSQSALTVVGNNLFAVNAGSNSLTMFVIDSKDPTKLTMLGRPVQVPGEFPVTVGASSSKKLVCVGCTGARAGVACSKFSAHGLEPMDTLRPFNLGQTTPPLGPTNTVSHVFFSKDGGMVFSTVKGDPPNNKTGFLASFPVAGGSVSQQGAQSSPEGTAVLFGSAVIPGSKNLFVTDAAFGGAVLSIDAAGKGTTSAKVAIDGQKATCWVTINPATRTAFVTDVATNRLVEMSTADASIKSQIDLSANGDPGLIDIGAAGRFLYALSPGNGTIGAAATVVDAVLKKEVQHVQLGSLGVSKNAMGMAVLK